MQCRLPALWASAQTCKDITLRSVASVIDIQYVMWQITQATCGHLYQHAYLKHLTVKQALSPAADHYVNMAYQSQRKIFLVPSDLVLRGI